MSNSFTLRDGQTVTIDFAQEPNLGDFTKLIALLELQRSFLDGSPAPQVVVDVRSAAPEPKRQRWTCAVCGEYELHWHHDIFRGLTGPSAKKIHTFVRGPAIPAGERLRERVAKDVAALNGATIVDDPPDAD